MIKENFESELFVSLLKGYLGASLLFLVLALIQYCYGFSLKTFEVMPMEERLPTGYYRVRGFYGHPLSLASVALFYLAFFLTLLTFSFKKFSMPFLNIKTRNGKEMNFRNLSGVLSFLVFANFIVLLLTGSRSATVIGISFFLAFVFFLFYKSLQKTNLIRAMKGLMVLLVAFVFILYGLKELGVFEKLINGLASFLKTGQLDPNDHRTVFWRVYLTMFLDHPLGGYGTTWVETGVRERYYDLLGYGSLKDKFNAHNNYLELLGALGLIGASIFTYVTFKLGSYFALLLNGSSLRFLKWPFFMGLLINLCQALFQNVFFDSSVTYAYLGLMMPIMALSLVNPHPTAEAIGP
jgi:O-antigen ligase